MKIAVNEARVRTASVEIKTLSVSGKQVTLALFRQLLEKPLIDDDGMFTGLPWGTINYHPDRCAKDPKHVHVVWQLGDELRRAAIRPPSTDRLTSENIDMLLLSGLEISYDEEKYKGRCALPTWARMSRFSSHAFFTVEGIGCRALLPFSSYDFSGNIRRDKVDEMHLTQANDAPSFDEALKGVKQEVRDLIKYRAKYSKRWEEIGNLPQIFIAV